MTALESTASLQFALDRSRARIAVLEQMIEDRTRELYLSHQTLSDAHEDLVALHEAMPGWLLIVTPEGRLRRLNAAAARQLGLNERRLPPTLGGVAPQFVAELPEVYRELTNGERVVRREASFDSPDGVLPMLVSVSLLHGPQPALVCVAVDLRERKQLELELRQAQKLEAVGQLAAGIAHEINTPLQFTADNLHFIQTAFGALTTVFEAQRAVCEHPELPGSLADQLGALEALREDTDLDYVTDNVPQALQKAAEGIARISTLVQAMKAFSHPSREKCPTNLNDCLTTTLTVARNEYKYVADVVTEFTAEPRVLGSASELNQVFLNLIVNAAHAIEERQAPGERGTITIRTAFDADVVVVSVADTGGGIPPAIAHRIFEPFFTTKEVGRGTGQGLAISRQVVNGHGGTISFTTVEGEGTTFHVRIPALEPRSEP